MRTISADNDAILRGGAHSFAFRLSVKDAGGTFRDLTTYPHLDMVEDLAWGEDLDSPGVTWSASITREQELVSTAPFMEDSPLNRAFDPANTYAALIQVGRRMKVEYSLQAEGDPRARSWALAFEGYIDTVDSAGGDTVKLSGRGLEAAIVNAFIERERVYAYAQGAYATKGAYIWTPSTVWVLGDLILPTDSKTNGHFYRVTTAGTGAATEPAYPTGGGSTVACGTAVFTESGATSTSVGTDVEVVIQQILDDNLGAGAVTLWCPVSPGWEIVWFLVSRQSTFTEIKALADQIGWGLRFMDNAGTPELKLFDPNRATTTSLRSFGPADVDELKSLKVEWQGIRNAIRVIYSDSQDLDAGGNPKRKMIERTDSASIAKYGRLFAEIAEGSNSNIDSATESQALADAVLSDLSEPTADMQAILAVFFAFVEITDLYTLTADGVHFSANQKLAVSSYQHHAGAGDIDTTIRLRGKPASNGKKGWFELFSDAVGGESHQITALENTFPIFLTVDDASVGGGRIEFDWHGAKSPKDAHFELHLSTSAGFTPSSSTLAAVGKERFFEVGNLNPEEAYYAQVLPIIWNGQKPVRGQASEEVTFFPGRAKATHLTPQVVWSRLPLNGGFETLFDPAKPPDFWFTSGTPVNADWDGVQVTLGTSGGIEGAHYVKLKTNNAGPSNPAIFSGEFSVNELGVYSGSCYRKTVGGAGANVTWGILYYDDAHSLISGNVETIDLGSSVGTWVQSQLPAALAPSGARFGRMFMQVAVGASGREIHLDSMEFDTLERWHIIGGSGEPVYQNFWAAYTGTIDDLRFRYRAVDGRPFLELGGRIKSGVVAGTAATLPALYWPPRDVYVPCSSNNAYGEILVTAAGLIVPNVGSNLSFDLAGIRIPLDSP